MIHVRNHLHPAGTNRRGRLSASPKEELLMKKTAVGNFHILPTESEAPGTKIKSLFNRFLFFKEIRRFFR
jgi:hypothetical protein